MARRFSTGSLGSQYKTKKKKTTKKKGGRAYKPPTTTTVSKPKAPPTITSRRDEAIAPAVPTVTAPTVPDISAWTSTTAQMAMDAGLTSQSTLGISAPKSALTESLEQMTKTQETLFGFPKTTALEETLSPEVLKGLPGTQTQDIGGLPPGVTLDADFKNQMAIALNQFTGGAGAMTPSEWKGAYGEGPMVAPYISDPTQKVRAPAGFEYLQDWFDNPQLKGAAFNVMQTSTMMSEFGIPPTMVTTAVRVGMGWTKYDMEDMGYIQDPLGNWFLEEDDAGLPIGDTGVSGDGGASTGGYGRGTSLGRGYPSTYGGGGANLINWRIRI